MGSNRRKSSRSTLQRVSGHRDRKPVVDALERRDLMVTQIFFPSAVPQYLFPANGRSVSIHVSGNISTSHTDKPPVAHFRIVDKYRQFEPQGVVALTMLDPNAYHYSFDVKVPAKNGSLDKEGRFFNVLVEGTDVDSTAGTFVRVYVPGPDASGPKKTPTKSTSTGTDSIPTTIETSAGLQPLSPRQLNAAQLAYAAAHPAPAKSKAATKKS